MARNRPADAVPHLHGIVSSRPNDAQALADLGAAYAMLSRSHEAIDALEASLRLRPDNAQAHFNLGLIAARSGKYEMAVQHFEQAVRLEPANREMADALTEAHAALARTRRSGTRE